MCHINAEQKRRCNIKNGFDTLHSLIPMLNQNPNIKVITVWIVFRNTNSIIKNNNFYCLTCTPHFQMSKAAMLQKGAEYIMQLQNERQQLKQEMDSLKQQIETLNSEIWWVRRKIVVKSIG